MAIVVIFLLLKTAQLPNSQKNGFSRSISLSPLVPLRSTQLPLLSLSIAGILNGKIYLSVKNPDFLILTDTLMRDLSTIRINPTFNLNSKINNSVFTTDIDSLGFKVFAKNLATVFCHSTKENRMKTYNFHKPFHYARSIQDSNFIYRATESLSKHSKLYKLNTTTGIVTTETTEEPLLYGVGIKADGQLLVDTHTGYITYVHYYHNHIVTIDSNLTPIQRFSTIDTIRADNAAPSNKNPPLVINHTGYVFNGILFVASNLKADNEKEDMYHKNIPIDVYHTVNGNYMGSFYIPLSKGKLLKSMAVTANRQLICLYHSNELRLYDISHLPFINVPN